jgi:hypothetical protein
MASFIWNILSGGGKKRKLEEVDFSSIDDPEEREIEQDFFREKAAKEKRNRYRFIIKKLQTLYAELRETDSPTMRDFIVKDISQWEKQLDKYKASRLSEQSMYTFTDIDEDELSRTSTGRRLRFGYPQLAFYPVDEIGKKKSKKKHSSLEELRKHNEEMSEALKRPIWLKGGRRKSKRSCY